MREKVKVVSQLCSLHHSFLPSEGWKILNAAGCYATEIVMKSPSPTDMTAEEIQLESVAASLAVGDLPKRVPESAARYHLYRFDHNYEGDFYHSVCECFIISFLRQS